MKGGDALGNNEEYRPRAVTVRDARDLLNSLFRTAKIDVNITELVIAKEEVVVAYKQVEDYERELRTVEKRDGFERGSRYLAAATIAKEARQVQVYVRFYLTSNGELKIEECQDDSVTLVGADEANQPERWRPIVEDAVRWGPVIIKIVLQLLGHIQ